MQITVNIVALLLVAGPAQAASPTFEDCESASNYGYNTSWQFVSSVMNKAACAEIQVRKGEIALARQAKRQKIPPHNTDALKTCFYTGLYAGYIDALVVEFEQCNDDLPLASVARAAAAVFTAMHEALSNVNDGVVDTVFDDVFDAPDLDPGPLAEQCFEVIYDDVLDLEAGLDELVETVCENL
jgi:hypothetical protein